MTVIRGLSPLVRLRDFSFWRMKVRVTGGALCHVPYDFGSSDFDYLDGRVFATGPYGNQIFAGSIYPPPAFFRVTIYTIDFSFERTVVFSSPLFLHIGGTHSGPWVGGPFPFVAAVNPGDDDAVLVVRGLSLSIPFGKLHSGVVTGAVGYGDGVSLLFTPGPVFYDPLPDVLANLDHFGQRLEVWLETELSGGSREWRRLFRSAPAAQVSIGPLQDAGYVDEEGYIVRMPESGWLPVFGRNALGPYSQIDQFNPSRAS